MAMGETGGPIERERAQQTLRRWGGHIYRKYGKFSFIFITRWWRVAICLGVNSRCTRTAGLSAYYASMAHHPQRHVQRAFQRAFHASPALGQAAAPQ